MTADQPGLLPGGDRYTFGDNPTAGERLGQLAAAYEPATILFVQEWAPAAPALVVDLGCGPGHTTRLLHQVTGAVRTIGLDGSAAYVETARTAAPAGVHFTVADVTLPALPVPPADVVFARFLLTHLADPVAALAVWAAALAEGGRLLVQESALLTPPSDGFARYYDLVAALQRHHGQALDIGARLGELAAAAGLAVAGFRRRHLLMPAAVMARLHVLNLRTWRHEDYIRDTTDAADLDDLDAWLVAVASGARRADAVGQDLGELVIVGPHPEVSP